jgi:hypothetical protein
LNRYLADKLNLSPQSLTRDLIEARLEEKNMSSEIIQMIRNFFDGCDQIRFGKITSAELDRKVVVKRIREIINLMERK